MRQDRLQTCTASAYILSEAGELGQLTPIGVTKNRLDATTST
jgi:hypothetical protein